MSLLGMSALLLVVLGAAAGAGCSPSIERREWDDPKIPAAVRAKAITQLRKEAVDLIAKFRASDSQNVELLDEAIRKERLTTQISPSGCPSCFREYGKALSIRGHFYRVEYETVLEELDVVTDPEEKADLEDWRGRYKEEMESSFRESNKAYRIYFANPDTPIIPTEEYERVMRHHEYMGEYDMAIRYLEQIAAQILNGVRDEARRLEIRRNVETLREFYRRRLQSRREDAYRRTGREVESGSSEDDAGRRRAPRSGAASTTERARTR
jgi:tetratricopeptide (TPR) repeat protein